jgi:hypothetical protein
MIKKWSHPISSVDGQTDSSNRTISKSVSKRIVDIDRSFFLFRNFFAQLEDERMETEARLEKQNVS